MKKIISVIMSIVMLFGISSVAVTAEEPRTPSTFSAMGDLTDDINKALDRILGYFGEGVNNSEIFLEPTDDPDVFKICLRFEENDGDIQKHNTGAYYNAKTGEVYSSDYEKGIFGTGFNYNAITKVFYAMNECWHRAFGFTPFYDLLAKLAFDYTTTRIFFDYGGKEWMVQLWKGNYFFNLFVGGEVGIYNRPANSTIGFKYNCVSDDEMVPMSIKISDKNRVYFDREPYLCWWATGFVIADRVNPRSLTMETSIEFPDQEMFDAFAAAASKKRGVKCEVEGTTAYIVW